MDEQETIDMDAVADLVRSSGIPCSIEQTGGGTATIYAGKDHGYPEQRRSVIAGPGVFRSHTGLRFSDAWAWSEEFSIGRDDDGDTDAIECEDMTDVEIAASIIRLVREVEA